jgi:hypothetical protein
VFNQIITLSDKKVVGMAYDFRAPLHQSGES